jgi:hypothetical protein
MIGTGGNNYKGFVFAPAKQGERTDLVESTKLSQTKRAEANGVSRFTQKRLDRLARDYPALHEQVKQGVLTLHRAGIQAGFVKELTALDALKRAWVKASKQERKAFLNNQHGDTFVYHPVS